MPLFAIGVDFELAISIPLFAIGVDFELATSIPLFAIGVDFELATSIPLFAIGVGFELAICTSPVNTGAAFDSDRRPLILNQFCSDHCSEAVFFGKAKSMLPPVTVGYTPLIDVFLRTSTISLLNSSLDEKFPLSEGKNCCVLDGAAKPDRTLSEAFGSLASRVAFADDIICLPRGSILSGSVISVIVPAIIK